MHPYFGVCAMGECATLQELLSELRGAWEEPRGCRGSCSSFFGKTASHHTVSSFLNGQRIAFYQTDAAYFAYVNVHGVDRSSLKVTNEDGQLVVSKAGSKAAGPSTDVQPQEWEVLGTYSLPDDVLQDGIYARLENGELFLSLTRIPKDPPKEVPIDEVTAEVKN